MSWYGPGRNPNHPGDPPPKWAPLGRAARIALLATVITGVVIALVITATRSAGGADGTGTATGSDLAATPGTGGQRIELPLAGLAVTFPADWVVEFADESSEGPILFLAQPGRFGPEVGLESLLVAEGPNPHERDTLTVCTLVRYAPIDLTADEFLNEIFGQSDPIVVESLREGLSRSLVNVWLDSRILAEAPEALYVDHYAIAGDNIIAVLWCSGAISHRSDWLSIAETVEFLP